MKIFEQQIIITLFVILINQVHLMYGSTFYCKIEEKLCNHLKHAGCRHNNIYSSRFNVDGADQNLENDDSSTQPSAIPHQVIEFNNEFILSVLDIFNTGRNQLAHLTKTSNMQLLTWDAEFQYLATLTMYVNETEYCVATTDYPNAKVVHYVQDVTDGTDPNHDMDVIIRNLDSLFSNSRTHQSHTSPLTTIASISKIGCSAGILVTEGEDTPNKIYFQCIYNDDGNQIASNKIESVCSKCNELKTTCNNLYTGLCGKFEFPQNIYNKITFGDDNGSGSGHNDGTSSKIDVVLWFLGALLFLGLLFTCVTKMRKIYSRIDDSEQGVVISEKLYRDNK